MSKQLVAIRHVMQLIPWLEPTLIGGLLLAAFCVGLETVPFHPDESGWIGKSYYLEAFIGGQFASPVWEESYQVLTQPPVVLYITGLGRLAGGYHVADLNDPGFDMGADLATNIVQGSAPSADLLWWSRLPMAVLAAMSGLFLFYSVSRAAGRTAGYVWLLLFVGSTYFSITLRQAMSEAPLLAAVALAIRVGDRALCSWQRAAEVNQSFRTLLRPLAWFILLGVVSGIAGAIKLNGMSIAAAGVAMCGLATFTCKGNVPQSTRVVFMIRASVILLLATQLTFVIVNPYLYPDPLRRTGKLFKVRLQEMQFQQATFSEHSIDGLADRINIVPQRIFENLATIHFSGALLINLALCVGGLGYLINRAWRWVQAKHGESTSVAILLVALAVAMPPLFTPLDWARYYLLPIVFSTICIAIGIARGISRVVRHIQVWPTSKQADQA